MAKHLDILHRLILDKEINRREKDMLIALKSFDFEDSNVISIGLKSLLDYFCIKNKECIYSILRKLQSKNYIRIEKKRGKKNVYVIIKDYLSGKDVEDSGYTDETSHEESRYIDETSDVSGHVDVSSCEEGRYNDVPSSRYADVSGNEQGGYTDVSSHEESRYIDETSGISGHVDVSSCEEGRYTDVPSSGYADVSGNEQGGYTDVSSNEQGGYTDVSRHEESRYTDETSDVSRHVDVSSFEEGSYNDVPSSGYADVSGNEQGGYTDVSSHEESRYTDETSDASGHVDVSSFEEGRYKDVPSTGYTDVSTQRNNIYINNNNNNNNNNNKNKIFINNNKIFINNNKIYINIINYWNSKKIGKAVSLNIKVIDSINKAMSKYSFAEIKKAIDNYAKVYISDYFYDFQWHLSYFLTRNNAIGKFVDDGEIWLRYKKKYYTLRDEYEEWGINTEDYINSI